MKKQQPTIDREKEETAEEMLKKDIGFQPDWSTYGTIEQLEKELVNFKFNGTGWYHFAEDTLLLLPVGRPIETLWHKNPAKKEVFRVFIYNNWNPKEFFAEIGTAPTRTY